MKFHLLHVKDIKTSSLHFEWSLNFILYCKYVDSVLNKGVLYFTSLGRLPFSIRVLLESAIRNCDGFQVKSKDVENILDWENNQKQNVEIPFMPARVILQDFT